jgi:peptide chain release factor 3
MLRVFATYSARCGQVVRVFTDMAEAERWVEGGDAALLKRFENGNEGYLADDHTGALVFLARNSWHLETTQKEWPELRFAKTKEQ